MRCASTARLRAPWLCSGACGQVAQARAPPPAGRAPAGTMTTGAWSWTTARATTWSGQWGARACCCTPTTGSSSAGPPCGRWARPAVLAAPVQPGGRPGGACRLPAGVRQAWDDLYYLERAAEVLVRARSMGLPLQPVPEDTCRAYKAGFDPTSEVRGCGWRQRWPAAGPDHRLWCAPQEQAWQFFQALKRELRRGPQAGFEDGDDRLPEDCLPGRLRARPQQLPGDKGPRAPALPALTEVCARLLQRCRQTQLACVQLATAGATARGQVPDSAKPGGARVWPPTSTAATAVCGGSLRTLARGRSPCRCRLGSRLAQPASHGRRQLRCAFELSRRVRANLPAKVAGWHRRACTDCPRSPGTSTAPWSSRCAAPWSRGPDRGPTAVPALPPAAPLSSCTGSAGSPAPADISLLALGWAHRPSLAAGWRRPALHHPFRGQPRERDHPAKGVQHEKGGARLRHTSQPCGAAAGRS